MTSAYGKEYKHDKNIKKIAIGTICSLVTILVGFTGATIGVGIYQKKAEEKAEKILSTTNYAEFNEEQRLLQIDKLLKDYEEGKISSQEFIRMSNEIEDYDKLKYIKTSTDVSEKEREAYIDAVKDVQAGDFFLQGGMGAFLIGGLTLTMAGMATALGVEHSRYSKGYPERTK